MDTSFLSSLQVLGPLLARRDHLVVVVGNPPKITHLPHSIRLWKILHWKRVLMTSGLTRISYACRVSSQNGYTHSAHVYFHARCMITICITNLCSLGRGEVRHHRHDAKLWVSKVIVVIDRNLRTNRYYLSPVIHNITYAVYIDIGILALFLEYSAQFSFTII